MASVVLAGLLLTLLCAPISAAYGAVFRQDIPASYQIVAENELFQLYVDSTTLAFKLLDKRSDYLWHSGIDELQEGDRLNRSWQAFARSGISIEYLDNRAVNSRASIANANHTLEVTPIEQGISARVTFQDYGISVGVDVRLEADGVRVEIPYESIREDNPDFRLGLVYVYPFLGATRGGSVPGYMFVPDGIGSLIRFADSTKARNMMYGRYYGPDLGMLGIQPYDGRVTSPVAISFPVFGMVHGVGQNAFFSVVETGAAYGEVQVHPAGIITNFNFLYNAFIYNETYFQATNRSGAGVTTIQRQTNAFDAVIHYRFLTGEAASYVGMARGYQQYLLDKGLLHRQVEDNPNIGIRLEFLGGDKEKILFWNRFIPMTTVGQMRDILANLDLPNPEVIYFGWQPLGASSMPPTSLALEGSLGSLSDLQALAEDIAAGGGYFSLYYDPQVALWEEPGYSVRSDVAMAITQVYIEGFSRYYNHYFSIETLRRRYAELSADMAARLNAGLALDSIGSNLYSDYRDRTPFNREQAIAAYQAVLSESPSRLGLYRPNDYLFSVAQAYYDMPPGSNGYIFTSEPVPFVPIVLAGYMPYYGTALNFSSNRQEDLLSHAEFGIYPSYFLTSEPTANMLNTRSSWIYTSSYAQWGEEIRQTYQWMNGLLAPVRGQEIVAHGPLAEGVFATTYASGSQIVVNYTDQPFTYRGITITAKDAALVENGS
ncbi:MAG: hypothetical protein JNM70_04260 [Anaerolineae bacterium]|nr:hypothetical protein [Anaerolineae bacterium]